MKVQGLEPEAADAAAAAADKPTVRPVTHGSEG